MSRREYHSPLREKQAAGTREAIVDALVEQVSDESLADFSMPKVAERAGVSVRTIYRYFPTREDLLLAVRERWKQSSLTHPATPEELPAHVRTLFQSFEDNAAGVMAALQTQLGQEAHALARGPRLKKIRRMIDELVPDLDEAERRGLFAVVRALSSADAWRTMRDVVGPEHIHDAAEAAAWTLGLVLKEAKKKNERAARARASHTKAVATPRGKKKGASS